MSDQPTPPDFAVPIGLTIGSAAALLLGLGTARVLGGAGGLIIALWLQWQVLLALAPLALGDR